MVQSDLGDPYLGYNDFEIDDISYQTIDGRDLDLAGGDLDTDEAPEEIQPEYKAPSVSVDSSGRFAEHEIIGGTTVRQKIGNDPLEISVSGVCIETTASQINKLRYATYGTIYSDVLPGNSIKVQFASVSTSPLEDSGAVPLSEVDSDFESADDREFLYNFELSCVEVTEI